MRKAPHDIALNKQEKKDEKSREQPAAVEPFDSSWLHNPNTRTLLAELDEMIDECIDTIANNALNPQVTDTLLRQYAVKLNTLRNIKNNIERSE